MSIRFRRMVYVGLACLGVSPALAQNVSPTIAELATYAGADRTERLIAGAKKEGDVSVYSSVTVDDQKALVNAIEKSAAEMESLHRERLLVEVKSPHIADIVPAALRPHREWVGDRLNIISAGYNTNLVRKQDVPKSYDDLLDPKWKGKLGIEADDAVWFGALANAMGEQKALKLFRDVVRTNGLSVRKGHTLLANLVVSGEVPFSLTLYHYKAEQLKNAGAPIDWYVLPPGFARFLGTGILRRPPHPHGAVLFLDFMLSDAQRVLLDRDFTPTNMKVKPLDIAFNVIDPAQVLDQGEKWQKLYDEIVIKQGK